jgi:hypothetical protein
VPGVTTSSRAERAGQLQVSRLKLCRVWKPPPASPPPSSSLHAPSSVTPAWVFNRIPVLNSTVASASLSASDHAPLAPVSNSHSRYLTG